MGIGAHSRFIFFFIACFVAYEYKTQKICVKESEKHKDEMSDQASDRLCLQNPYSHGIVDSFETVAKRMDTWLEPSHFQHVVEEATNNDTWKIDWNIFTSIAVMTECKKSERLCIGGSCRNDESKITCGLRRLEQGCVIYSIGGNDQWAFEIDALEKTPCSIHTFDCTGPARRFHPPKHERLHFHHLCLGSEQDAAPKKCLGKYMVKCGPTWTLGQIQRNFGHRQIDLLKMDIEGWEWPLMDSWAETTTEGSNQMLLPMQVNVELHTKALVDKTKILEWTPVEVATMYQRLLRIGYAVVVRDDNMACPHCSELTLLRVRC